MFTNILVPLDGTDLAEGILPYVARIAGGVGARLTLLMVVDPYALAVPDSLRGDLSGRAVPAREREQAGEHPHEAGGPFVQQILENVERRAEAHLRQVAARLEERGVSAGFRVVEGPPAERIAAFAEEEGCDLVAMSTHGRNLIARGVLGSVTDKIIHSVRVPVLTITPDRASEYHQGSAAPMTGLLAPLDGSELAEEVLPYVESLALAMSLKVTLAKALLMPSSAPAYVDRISFASDAKMHAQMKAEAAAYLGGVESGLSGRGIEVESRVVTGTPATAIADLARESGYDIIALATHGRSGISRWVLGSVTETLVRTSAVPVLVVPPRG